MIPGLAVLGGVAIYSIRSLATVSQRLDEISRALEGLQALELTVLQTNIPLRAHLFQARKDAQHSFEQLLDAADRRLDACANASCHETSFTPKEMAAKLAPSFNQLRARGRLIFKVSPRGTLPGGFQQLTEIDKVSAGIGGQLQTMSAVLAVHVNALRERARILNRHASAVAILVTLAVFVIGSAGATMLGRRLSRPIRELLFGIRRVTAGDWNYRVQASASGEVGDLASAFNAMVDQLEDYREQLRANSRDLEERVRRRTEELKRTEEALSQSEKLASLGLLASGVAHELNNPLTTILMNVNLMMEEIGQASGLYPELEKVAAEAMRCKRIIEDMRTFARPHSLDKTPCRVTELAEHVAGLVEHEFTGRGIRLLTEIPAELPKVAWDAERMQQVLTNVLTNAAQATPAGGTVRVAARTEGESLVLEVRDTGAGIPKGNRGRVFDPFFTTKPTGTGLGLSISYGIVQDHGGRIELESVTPEEAGADGQAGTTVRIIMPLGRGEA